MSPMSIFQKFLSFDILPIAVFLLSIGLQLAAAVYALILIRITGRKSAWILISIAMVLMTSRRIVSFISILTAGKEVQFDIPELIALVIAALLLLGVLRIRSYFQSIILAETERKKAEKFLHESEERYRTLYENNPLMFFILNAEGIVLSVNRAGAKQLGYAVEELIGRPVLDVFYEDDKQAVVKQLAACLQNPSEVFQWELRKVHKNGNIMHVQEMASVFRDSSGNINVLVACENITDRKKAEEALRESEERFRLLTESSLTSVYLIQDNLFRYVNPALASIFGYEVEEIINMLGPLDLTASEDRDLVAGNIRKRIEGGVHDIRYSFKGLRKDGMLIDVEVHGARIDYKGKTAVIGTLLDITERKRAEEERAFLANITEHATDAIAGLDLDTNIVSWNRGAEMIFGYRAEEIIGKPWSLVVPHEAQDACRDRFKKATFEGFVKTAETIRVAKDGRRFPAEMTLTALKDEKGEHIGFVTITRDITERKKLENQLRQAQKMEAIGQLAGGIAHDFNNMLNAIIGFGSLMEMNMREDDPNRVHLKEILSAGERATHLTHSLLAFSRKQIIDLKPQNLNEIIMGVEKFLRRIIGEDIELKTELSDKDLTVFADRGQIEQVLMNLATNAMDAMPDGGELIIETGTILMDEEHVRRHGYGESGMYALLSVTDSGIGMDEKTRERIFEPFFTTKELGRGTGLGLSIVYGIVKQHDGYINVYSEPQKGTTFKIYLPLTKSEVAESVGATPAAYPESGTETVLVAEDDQAVRKLTRDMLERFGYKVIAAEDGGMQ